MTDQNIVWHEASVTKEERQQRSGAKSCVLWFTGLSGSGKSTLANAINLELFRRNLAGYVLDGDNVRHGLNADLGFSDEDRVENIRRIGEVSKLFVDAGVIVSTAFISPFREDRHLVRERFKEDEFIEIYVDCPLHACEERDVKGLYKKAREGTIPNFTGISSPYEPPTQPEITINTDVLSVEEGVLEIVQYLDQHNYISRQADE